MRDILRKFTYYLLNKFPKGKGIHIILVYHAVGENIPQSVSKDDFYRHMLHLKKYFTIVKLKNFVKLANNNQAKNIVALTFDDGYLADFNNAVPILEEFNFPATFFIPTDYIGEEFPVSSGTLPVVNKRQVKLLHDKGFEVGSHTVTHRTLVKLNEKEILPELEKSKLTLSNLTGSENLPFAYPKGQFNKSIATMVQRAGYKLAVTTEERTCKNENPFLLPRISINRRLNLNAFSVKTSNKLFFLRQLKKRTSS